MRPVNPTALTEEQQQLAAGCFALAHDEAYKHWQRHPHLDLEECTGQALESLVYAARAYDPERGYRFTTYAVTTIKNRYKNAWKYSQTQLRRCPTQVLLASDMEGVDADESSRDWWAGGVEDEPPQELVPLLQKHCSEEDWNLLWLHYVMSWRYDEIAAHLKLTISRQGMQDKIRRALHRLQRALPRKYVEELLA